MKKIPTSVYRLQLNEKFTLKQATALLPYLKELGIEGVYCSPYFAARSPHGYDIIDPNRLNPQVATEKDFERFCQKLRALGLFHIIDVVPNHMGILGGNKWWLDLLEKGKASRYAPFFDIDWSQKMIRIPILPVPYEEALERGDFTIVRKGGKLWLKYGTEYFPIRQKLKNVPKTLEQIDGLLRDQHYRLVSWLSSGDKISYRRFFNISELVGVRIEDDKVLQAHHKWIFQLLKEKKVDGLRVDHPDGLYDPKKYFDDLRKKHKGLIVVEKILGFGEDLPTNWDVEGTVGYEYLNFLTGLFVKQSDKLTEIYYQFIHDSTPFEEILHEKKRFYLEDEMEGDLNWVSSFLKGKPIESIEELLITFPIYRSYIPPKGKILKRDLPYIQKAFEKAKTKKLSTLSHLEQVFHSPKKEEREFLMRFQQLSAPVMAKGFEDITLYNYNRLLALNEVGGSPERGGVTVDEFHTFCQKKQKKWPLGFLASSTHDTKRSLDVRMQIAVLSEIPEEWGRMLRLWSKVNAPLKTEGFPDPNAEYFLYQTLLGVWPSRPSPTRIWESFQKSLREARVHTSWRHPNLVYEKACQDFVDAILKKGSPFLKAFLPFQKEVQEFGEWNSLAATALKLGSPGIVELYQGCEEWRYLLVDPDNRQPVHYAKTTSEKKRLHQVGLAFRSQHKALFLEGEYHPLKVTGPGEEHVVAFMRTYKKERCLIAAVRFFATLVPLDKTFIHLPQDLGEGEEVFSNKTIRGKKHLAFSLFEQNPYAWVFWG